MNDSGSGRVSVKIMNRFMLDITRQGGSFILNKEPGTVCFSLPIKAAKRLRELGYDFWKNKDLIGLTVDVVSDVPPSINPHMNVGLKVQVIYSLTKLNV
jgi:hypothetical protein